MKKINIVTGHYGSGKTEFALNYALRLKDKFDAATICDMDIVNPYFRTNDAVDILRQRGVSVIAPEYANTNLDLPSLPSDIISVFEADSAPAVLDVGGDEDGAIALGQFYKYISNFDYNMFLVVNALRPDTSSLSDIIRLAREIELSSRCKITAIVNNTNLAYLSSAKDIIDSFKLFDGLSSEMGLPVSFVSGREDILDSLGIDLGEKRFPLELFMQLPFDAMA